MGEIVVAESGNPDEALDMDKAREVAETLNATYPGYLWLVCFQGRALVVKLGQIQASMVLSNRDKAFGFVIKHSDAFSATDLARQAVMAGGEILERAGLSRGRWNGSLPTKVDCS